MPHRRAIIFIFFAAAASAQLSPTQKAANTESFEVVWKTVRDRHPDRNLNGLDWQAIHDSTRPLIVRARSMDEVRAILNGMLAKLGASHYAIIPGERYRKADPPRAAPAPPTEPPKADKIEDFPATPELALHRVEPASEPPPQGKLVTFGNLPEQLVTFESRTLEGGVGYIRFNEFLDPVSIMPKFEAAMKQFAHAPGVVLDLRGNRGGIGIMAMGIAGFFVEKEGQQLGEMHMRDATLKFVVFPRPETYPGPLAILVDERSASTTEILAQGLQDLGRARIFGTRTAAAALPSDIVRLPNGDGFQFAQASYTSYKGRILEGNGVTPDVEVRQTESADRAGHDLVIEAAVHWIASASH